MRVRGGSARRQEAAAAKRMTTQQFCAASDAAYIEHEYARLMSTRHRSSVLREQFFLEIPATALPHHAAHHAEHAVFHRHPMLFIPAAKAKMPAPYARCREHRHAAEVLFADSTIRLLMSRCAMRRHLPSRYATCQHDSDAMRASRKIC